MLLYIFYDTGHIKYIKYLYKFLGSIGIATMAISVTVRSTQQRSMYELIH